LVEPPLVEIGARVAADRHGLGSRGITPPARRPRGRSAIVTGAGDRPPRGEQLPGYAILLPW
jgi:hypothetical protein